jgi:hypothetical protein
MRRGLLPLLAVLAAGCGGGTTPNPGGTLPAGGTARSTPTAGGPRPPAVSQVELKAVTPAELDAAIASHKGKGVLIDCWFLG